MLRLQGAATRPSAPGSPLNATELLRPLPSRPRAHSSFLTSTRHVRRRPHPMVRQLRMAKAPPHPPCLRWVCTSPQPSGPPAPRALSPPAGPDAGRWSSVTRRCGRGRGRCVRGTRAVKPHGRKFLLQRHLSFADNAEKISATGYRQSKVKRHLLPLAHLPAGPASPAAGAAPRPAPRPPGWSPRSQGRRAAAPHAAAH